MTPGTRTQTLVSWVFSFSASFSSAQLLSRYRPRAAVIAVTRSAQAARQAHLCRGVFPLLYREPPEAIWADDVDRRVQFGIESGEPPGHPRRPALGGIVSPNPRPKGLASLLWSHFLREAHKDSEMVWPLWDMLREERGRREGRAVPEVSPALPAPGGCSLAGREERAVKEERGTQSPTAGT